MAEIENKSNENEENESLISHLVELRNRLLKSILAWLCIFAIICVYPGSSAIYDFLAIPLTSALPEGTKMVAIGVITPFIVPLKISLLVAFIFALPIILYQIWAFVAPGLYPSEKKLGLPVVLFSTLLFLLGMAFCYYFVFGQVFKFIANFAPASITPAPDIEAYLSFVITMFIAFGITFEVPIVLVALVKLGVLSVKQLKNYRSYFIVLAFVIAAIVTPPDVVSQLALAIPMCLLYEVGILVAKIIQSKSETTESENVENE